MARSISFQPLWRLAEQPSQWQDLAQTLGLPGWLARCLIRRGMQSPEQALAFLSPDWSHVHDPAMLPGLDPLLQRLRQAVDRREPILIFGDYDVDGMSATALALRCLQSLDVPVEAWLPHRLRDGYGLSADAVLRAAEAGYRLILTVDNGMTAFAAAEEAKRRGIDLLITDHHEPLDRLPDTPYIMNPLLPGHDIPEPLMAGVTVAWKLMTALRSSLGKEIVMNEDLQLVMLGTLADSMPQSPENRALVVAGLDAMRQNPLPGLAALAHVSGMDCTQVDASSILFQLTPRINAAGRVGEPTQGLALLLAETVSEAQPFALYLQEQNVQRRQIEQAMRMEAEHQVEQLRHQFSGVLPPLLLLIGKDWHPGVAGIVAAQIAEATGRPTLIGCERDGVCQGSGRSVGKIDLMEVLADCSPLLLAYGGHEGAVGFRFEADRAHELFAALLESAPEPVHDTPIIEAEEYLALADLGPDLMAGLSRLEPFAANNAPVLFWVERVSLVDMRRVGPNGEHLRLEVSEVGHHETFEVIAFRQGDLVDDLHMGMSLELLTYPEWNCWRGHKRIQLRAVGVRPARSAYADIELPMDASMQSRQEAAPTVSGTGDGESLIDFSRLDFIPDRSYLVRFYGVLRRVSERKRVVPGGEELRKLLEQVGGGSVPPSVFECCLQIMSELGFVMPLTQGSREVWLVPPPPEERKDLHESPTFRGLHSQL